MSASLKTTNYDLGIYAPNDVTSWLTDFNGNMNKIDAQMKANADGVQGNVGDINALGGRMTTAENDIEQLENEYGSMVEKTSATQLTATNTSNSNVTLSGIITNGALLGGHVEGIDKTGNLLSMIEYGEENYKFLPLINVAGNPLNLASTPSPTADDLITVGGSNILIYHSGAEKDRQGIFVAYFNGTNTLFGVSIPNFMLTENYSFNNESGSFGYII